MVSTMFLAEMCRVRPVDWVFARALAGDHDVDAVIAEDALELDDVGEPRDVLEDQRLPRSAGSRSSRAAWRSWRPISGSRR